MKWESIYEVACRYSTNLASEDKDSIYRFVMYLKKFDKSEKES